MNDVTALSVVVGEPQFDVDGGCAVRGVITLNNGRVLEKTIHSPAQFARNRTTENLKALATEVFSDPEAVRFWASVKPRIIFFFGRWVCGHGRVKGRVMTGGCDLDGTGITPISAYKSWLANAEEHQAWLANKSGGNHGKA